MLLTYIEAVILTEHLSIAASVTTSLDNEKLSKAKM